jgi:hypothetical protein
VKPVLQAQKAFLDHPAEKAKREGPVIQEILAFPERQEKLENWASQAHLGEMGFGAKKGSQEQKAKQAHKLE